VSNTTRYVNDTLVINFHLYYFQSVPRNFSTVFAFLMFLYYLISWPILFKNIFNSKLFLFVVVLVTAANFSRPNCCSNRPCRNSS